MNLMDQEGPFLKAEKDMLEKVLGVETEQLKRTKNMFYGCAQPLNKQDANTEQQKTMS